MNTGKMIAAALACQKSGSLDKAAEIYQSVIRVEPGNRAAHNNLGQIMLHRGEFARAELCFRDSIAIRNDDPGVHVNLGVSLMRQRRYADAIAACEAALRLDAGYAGALSNLAGMLKDLGRLDEAMAIYRRALAVPHDALTHSNYLLSLHYGNVVDRAGMFAAHRAWAARFAPKLPRNGRTYGNARDPGKRLKVGYLSSDFRFHPVAYFIGAVLATHDRSQLNVYCYSTSKVRDRMTGILQSMTENWRDAGFLDDSALAEAIEGDGVDVLVDLAGHTAENRMGTMARKPAPVQMTYLGYPDTTGLEALDYRITDGWVDPPGEADAFATESLIRLASCFIAYRAPSDAPPVADLPAAAAGVVTFGSFNNLAKLSAESLRLWARVLDAVPRSRLLLKSKMLDDPEVRAHVVERCSISGIPPDRLLVLGGSRSVTEVLSAYDQVDVALDPTPYNGTTTTCEALWMGVPVVTLAGDRHSARVGVSILNAAGLPGLVASTEADYVRITASLVKNLAELARLRSAMRQRLARSPLLDAKRLARELESAYRMVWQKWCGRGT